jgi:hypothetical protein
VKSEFTERSLTLKAIPPTEIRLQCETVCTFLLVERTEIRRIWRCEKCLRYIEAPVSRQHEIEWKKHETSFTPGAKSREALPDQMTIYDLFENGDAEGTI